LKFFAQILFSFVLLFTSLNKLNFLNYFQTVDFCKFNFIYFILLLYIKITGQFI